MAHKKFREQVHDLIHKQMLENTPPETLATYNRLSAMGYDDKECRQMICKCLAVELVDAMNNNKFFNEKRYLKNLNKLPASPEKVKPE